MGANSMGKPQQNGKFSCWKSVWVIEEKLRGKLMVWRTKNLFLWVSTKWVKFCPACLNSVILCQLSPPSWSTPVPPPHLGPKSQNSPCEKLSNCFACTEKSCNVTIFQLTHLLCNFYTLDLIYSTPESKSTVQGFCMIIFYGCLADKHLLYGSQ